MRILVIPDSHAHPDFNNDRAEKLSYFVINQKPDVIVNLGDQFDMPSLSSYDKGKKSFVGRSYKRDIEAGLEFHELLWAPIFRQKKKLPLSIFLIGNHEERIRRVIDHSPELEGTVSYSDLHLDSYYNVVVDYNGNLPGTFEYEGILFAHYISTGVSGRPIGGEYAGRSLLQKRHRSTVVGHSHSFDYSVQPAGTGFIHGLSAGCFIDYPSPWAGDTQRYWRAGVTVLDNVHDGDFDLRFYSLDAL